MTPKPDREKRQNSLLMLSMALGYLEQAVGDLGELEWGPKLADLTQEVALIRDRLRQQLRQPAA